MTQENVGKTVGVPLSILVVDDDELNRRMMQLLLKREGHSVDFAINGQEALEAVRSKRYDIVLMDLQMPVMDGLEASRQIRVWERESGSKHTYIVALTASYMPERGRELFEAGIDNYLGKPFEVDHLRNILASGTEGERFRTAPKMKAISPEMVAVDPGIDFQIGTLRVGGDQEIYRDLLKDFVDELPGKVDALKIYYKTQDRENLYRAAHNLKGVSANLGALQLSEHAARLEKQVKEGYNDKVEELLSDITTITRNLMKNALNFLGTGTGN